MRIQPSIGVHGSITVPGDKSISHRAVILGSIAEGMTEIDGFLSGADCLSTISCFEKMGVRVGLMGEGVKVMGSGLRGLKAPREVLYTGNSGTTTRLLTGLMAGQDFDCVIEGDESIARRPMERVIKPLREMGASIESREGGLCPLRISGRELSGMRYELPVASAQLKSAMLLAGLYAHGETTVIEPAPSRDHTERMLRSFGANLRVQDSTITVKNCTSLTGQKIVVPGDISSAAYFLAAGLIVPGSEITVRNVGVNPTRTGMLDVIRSMGGRIEITNVRDSAEPMADITVRFSELRGTVIGGELIPRLIDELPVIAVMAAFAQGETVIKDAAELKVKETNRIRTMAEEMGRAGLDVEETPDGMVIRPGKKPVPASFDSHGDHRVAMSCAVLALRCGGVSEIRNSESVNISFPGFFRLLAGVSRE